MSPTPITPTDRYVPAGETAVYWVATFAAAATPTRGELDAGVDLTAEVAAVVGWQLRSDTRNVQGLTQQFAVQVAAGLRVDGSDLVFYADRAGDDIAALLARDTAGHVVFAHGGDVEGNPMDVWPVKVAAVARTLSVDSEAARVIVQFVPTGDPQIGLAAPGVS